MKLLFCLLLVGPALASETIERETLTVPNITVRDQDGHERRFYDDLIKGKTVVMHFIFTSCPSVCPPMGANFAALQKQLDAAGEDVALISVSIDPVTDTPARLKQWRARFRGGDGWTLVTGSKQDIDRLLKMLRVFAADIDTHAPFVILGSDQQGWRYVNGLTPPEKLLAMLR